MKKLYFFLLIVISTNCFSQVELVKDSLALASTITIVNNHMLFMADTGHFPQQLWTSDGTLAGTHVVKQLNHGVFIESAVGSEVYDPVAYQNNLYFIASDSDAHRALWKSDGTAQGTILLHTFGTPMNGPYNSNFPYFCGLGNEVYFAAGDNANGVQLWKTDGTPQGTVLFKILAGENVGYGSQPAFMKVYKDKIYFSAYSEGHGFNLWVTDGTDVGTYLFKDNSPADTSFGLFSDGYFGSNDPQFTISGNYLYFSGRYQKRTNNSFLYRTDGTPQGTIVLDTVNQILFSQNLGFGGTQADVNGELYYMAINSVNDFESRLFKTDGTPAGTVGISTNDSIQAQNYFFSFKNKLYFNGQRGEPGFYLEDEGLYTSDGTTSGTQLVNTYQHNTDFQHPVDAGNSFFYFDEFNLPGTNYTTWYVVQSNGTTTGNKVFYGVVPFNYNTMYNGAFYFKGVDTATSSKHAFYKITPSTTLGVNELIRDNGTMIIYPNPTTEILTFHTPTVTNETPILKIFNLMGTNVYDIKVTSPHSSIDVSNWDNGIYFCTLEQNGSTQTIKVIVQH